MPFNFLAAEDNSEKALVVVKGHAQNHHVGRAERAGVPTFLKFEQTS